MGHTVGKVTNEFRSGFSECAVLQYTLDLPGVMGQESEQQTDNDRAAAMEVRQNANGGTKTADQVTKQ